MNILQQISADDTLRAQIRFREKAQRDQLARENAARQEGEKQKALQIAQKMLPTFDDQTIAQLTDLPLQEIINLRSNNPQQ